MMKGIKVSTDERQTRRIFTGESTWKNFTIV
jgi:hypothetical protein